MCPAAVLVVRVSRLVGAAGAHREHVWRGHALPEDFMDHSFLWPGPHDECGKLFLNVEIEAALCDQ